MFTGIINGIGTILVKGQELSVKVPSGYSDDLRIGDSVALDGVCLTVEKFNNDILDFFVTHHTLNSTVLQFLAPGTIVNLEKALVVGARVNGHFVTGHIDTIGFVVRKTQLGRGVLSFVVQVKPTDEAVIIEKGSIAVNGISLTIAEIQSKGLAKNITFHITRPTIDLTTIGTWSTGRKVNIEFDMLAKSAERAHHNSYKQYFLFDVKKED